MPGSSILSPRHHVVRPWVKGEEPRGGGWEGGSELAASRQGWGRPRRKGGEMGRQGSSTNPHAHPTAFPRGPPRSISHFCAAGAAAARSRTKGLDGRASCWGGHRGDEASPGRRPRSWVLSGRGLGSPTSKGSRYPSTVLPVPRRPAATHPVPGTAPEVAAPPAKFRRFRIKTKPLTSPCTVVFPLEEALLQCQWELQTAAEGRRQPFVRAHFTDEERRATSGAKGQGEGIRQGV